MKRTFQQAIEHRRSIYALSNRIDVSEQAIKGVVETALMNLPSAFNSQSTRIVLLTRENHMELWAMVKDVLKAIVPAEAFVATEKKIDNSFASGYGTILFYEDGAVIEELQRSFASYADKFPIWAEHTSAIHQFAIWTMLDDLHLGASLQHYNPLIDERIAARWNINPQWRLIAQMPFGAPLQAPAEKSHMPIEERFLVF